jgi:streptomycin 6-kinase
LGFDRERIYDWGFAQAVLSVVWSVEDTGKLENEGLYFVELLDAIKVS